MSERALPTECQATRRATLLLALVVLAALGLLPQAAPAALRWVPAVLSLGLWVHSLQKARSTLGFVTVVLSVTSLMAAGVLWQVALVLAVFGAALLHRYIPESGGARVEAGRVPVALTLFAGLVTPGALLGWVYLLEPDLSDLTGMIPNQPIGLLILGGLVFALVNATFEEWVWRGVFQPALGAEFGLSWAIGLQAASFGVMHAHGFPRGVVGVVLAGSWAVILGVLRHLAGGLLAPVLAHIVADATIASIVIVLARGG